MGFGGGGQYTVPSNDSNTTKQSLTSKQKTLEQNHDWVIKERPLEGVLGNLYREPTNTGNPLVDYPNALGNMFRHEQLIKKTTNENAGLFDDGYIREDAPENMEKYIQTDPNTYPAEEIEPKIEKAQQEQERTRSKFYEYRSGQESLGSTNNAYDEPYFYNIITNNCQDFTRDTVKNVQSKKGVDKNNIKSPFAR